MRRRSRRADYRRIKSHRSYTVDELAGMLCCHKNTVRSWLRQGLPLLEDGKRPALIHGATAREFLEARQRRAKQACAPDEMFCFKCKRPRRPALATADFRATSSIGGVLSGLCSECATLMFKRTSAASVAALSATLEIKFLGPDGRLMSSPTPLSQCHFG